MFVSFLSSSVVLPLFILYFFSIEKNMKPIVSQQEYVHGLSVSSNESVNGTETMEYELNKLKKGGKCVPH